MYQESNRWSVGPPLVRVTLGQLHDQARSAAIAFYRERLASGTPAQQDEARRALAAYGVTATG